MIEKIFKRIILLVTSLFLLSSCKNKNVDYFTYYKKVNEVDSIYRLACQPRVAAEEYQKLFKKYHPMNQERIEEYATYLQLADQYHIDFGGKKNLYKLIPLVAPYENQYKKYLPLFGKYGIDSTVAKQKITDWKKDLNTILVDSFKTALIRDQEGRSQQDTALVRKNIKKNAELLIWTLKHYGFPSSQKIGGFPMLTFLSHMADSKDYYLYLKTKLPEYIKSGDCLPRDYAMMIDTHDFNHDKTTYYGFHGALLPSIDSAQINRNRKSIGLPSLKHTNEIRKDFLKKLKKK